MKLAAALALPAPLPLDARAGAEAALALPAPLPLSPAVVRPRLDPLCAGGLLYMHSRLHERQYHKPHRTVERHQTHLMISNPCAFALWAAL